MVKKNEKNEGLHHFSADPLLLDWEINRLLALQIQQIKQIICLSEKHNICVFCGICVTLIKSSCDIYSEFL